MNLADPELELIDPTPNIHSLFMNFDKTFFWSQLAAGAVVRWSKRMYSCAGVCSYEGRGGLCVIALSEPLLKLRPRKNLIETLLHEMIHAYLFVTGNDRDRDGHGPNFQSHMRRLNQATGVNITIYHDFHDEVKLYQTHVWRCDGPCQHRKPYYGIVRRSSNRAPSNKDFWWNDHKRMCSGTFIKIKEPEKVVKAKAAPRAKPKPMGDISKYITNKPKCGCKCGSGCSCSGNTKSNGGGTILVNPKTVNIKTENEPKLSPYSGKGHVLIGDRQRTQSVDSIEETVRSVWLKKQETINKATNTKAIEDVSRKVKEVWSNKQMFITSNTKTAAKKPSTTKFESPPAKMNRIDNYFTSNSPTQSKSNTPVAKTTTIKSNEDLPSHVNCPVCSLRVLAAEINRHVDECLNKEAIEKLFETGNHLPYEDSIIKSQNNLPKVPERKHKIDLTIPPYKPKTNISVSSDSKNMEAYLRDFMKEVNLPQPEFKVSEVTVAGMVQFVDELNNTTVHVVDDDFSAKIQKCPCCELKIYKPMEEHLEECLAFFNSNEPIPIEGTSSSHRHVVQTIEIDDDDDDGGDLDESFTMNGTGTKTPCPICLEMVEQNDMNDHLDLCLA
ncbi:hypothetical protein JYU34_008512 [Plutella xylostella]|uniref:Protein with SprT-like domain at the N terminus n=1 Tax=Plutella xylostella TaxID=51655 RepID=A0ABQ7QL97_PLUXY|nr:hypothetical protein JYU34_008512 [Plutella xylostella]